VDFLEANEDFSVCSHRFKIFNEETKEWKLDYGSFLFTDNVEGIEFDAEFNFVECWLTQPLTTMFRTNRLDLIALQKHKYVRDVHLYYHLLTTGKGYCMNFFAGVYRQHAGGVYSGLAQNKRNILSYKVHSELYFSNKNDVFLKELALISAKPFYWDIKARLIKKEYSKSLYSDIKFFLKNESRLEGLKIRAYYFGKILFQTAKSLVKKK
jgi:hypothetical protein